MFNEAETIKEPIVIEPELETVVKTHNRKKSKRGSKLSNLEVKQVHYELYDEEKICDLCGEALTEMTIETRKELVIKPAQAYVIEHVTHIYSCRNCDKKWYSCIYKNSTPSERINKKIICITRNDGSCNEQ